MDNSPADMDGKKPLADMNRKKARHKQEERTRHSLPDPLLWARWRET
jgi:hypothetical protein